MVSIFTYRDERKLFAIGAGVLIATLVALLQIQTARTGKPNPITITAVTVLAAGQTVFSGISSAIASAAGGIASIPHLWQENARLRAQTQELSGENTRLREALANLTDERSIERVASSHPQGIVANTIGYDPESLSRTITLDRGSFAGITLDRGVVSDSGIVGRIIQATPFVSTVLLITDSASKVPAVVQRGHWWGIATGANDHVYLQYISQDAPLRLGDRVVTGEGLSFHAGMPIGRISKIFRSEGALYQTALLEPATPLGRLGHALVLTK